MTIEVAAHARRRALRFVGFLEAYYSLRYPPVHDIDAYHDLRLGPGDLPDTEGVGLRGGGEVWLSVQLVDLPPAPELPPELRDWVATPVSPREPPLLGPHPDGRRRRLLRLGAEPRVLDGDALAALQDDGVAQDVAFAELVAAREDLRRAEEHLAAWREGEWQAWSEHWQVVEAGRELYRTLFDLRVRMEREGDLFECVWGFGRLRWQPDGERVDQPLLCAPVEVAMDPLSGRLDVVPSGPTVLDVSWSLDLPVRDRASLNRLREALEDQEVDPWDPHLPELLRPALRAVDHDGVLVTAGLPRPPLADHAVVDPGEWVLFVRRRQPNFRGFLDEQRRLYEAGAVVPDPFAALAVDEASAFTGDDPMDLASIRTLAPQHPTGRSPCSRWRSTRSSSRLLRSPGPVQA